jgi:hypothetical protein
MDAESIFIRYFPFLDAFAKFRKATVKAAPLQAWTGSEILGNLGSQISRQSAQEHEKVVSPTHRPPLSPESIPGTSFC